MTERDSTSDRQSSTGRLRWTIGKFARRISTSPDSYVDARGIEQNSYLDSIEFNGRHCTVLASYIKQNTNVLQHDLLPHDNGEAVIVSHPAPIPYEKFHSYKFIRASTEYREIEFDDSLGFDSEIDDMPYEIFDITLNLRGEKVQCKPTTFQGTFSDSERPAKISKGSMIYRIFPSKMLDNPEYEDSLGSMIRLRRLHSAELKQLSGVIEAVTPPTPPTPPKPKEPEE